MLDTGSSPRRRRPGAVLAAALAVVTAWPGPVAGAPSPPTASRPAAIEAKRAEAARIAEALARQGEAVSILAEELNLARIEADERAAAVAAASHDLRRTEDEVARVRTVLKQRLVEAYAGAGGPPRGALSVLVGGPVEEMAVRRTYVNAVATSERADVGELEAATEAFEARRREMEAAEAAAGRVLEQVEDRRRAAEQAAAEQRATLAQVNGELAGLVEAERVRRAEEEARRARAELEARQARERAAAQARQAAEEAGRAARASTTTTTRASTTTTTRATASTRAPTTTATSGPTTTVDPETPPPVDGPGQAPGEPSRPPAVGAELAVAEAKRQLGKPYEYGSPGPDSFDCSGLTSHAWRAAGRSLPHSSRVQMSVTTAVPLADIRVGDLLFYGAPVHHVGIYAGGGQMVEASQTGTPVRMASIYRRDLVGVGRVR